MCVLEGLLEYERAAGDPGGVRDARRRGEEYLLRTSLFRSKRTGEVVDERLAAVLLPDRSGTTTCCARSTTSGPPATAPDERVAEAVAVVRDKRQPDGRWLLENTHPGPAHFAARGRRRAAQPREHAARAAGARLGRAAPSS